MNTYYKVNLYIIISEYEFKLIIQLITNIMLKSEFKLLFLYNFYFFLIRYYLNFNVFRLYLVENLVNLVKE